MNKSIKLLVSSMVILLTLALAACGYVVLLTHFYDVMKRPPVEFAQVWADSPAQLKQLVPLRALLTRARGGSLEVGDAAPGFALQTPDKSRTVRLSDFAGKRPVVLVFGSYT